MTNASNVHRALPDSGHSDEYHLRAELEEIEDALLGISHAIHARPETRFEEYFAAKLLVDKLSSEGFLVTQNLADLPTAFRAEYAAGKDGPTIAFFCEYDALEEIGHGCGHNIVAAAGLGAALLTKSWMTKNPQWTGRIVVIGSPGEEGGGGKALLLDSDCLDDIDAAMLIHPEGYTLSAMTTLARSMLDFNFKGKAAHAAVSPEKGVNALDASVLTLTAIGLLRQQLPPDVRVHAIVTHGGDVPNIIPETASIRAFVRAPDTKLLMENLVPRVTNCARGAALATGATVEITSSAPPYAAMQPNPVLARLVESSFVRVGRTPEPPLNEVLPGSTDMGNVSQLIPSIHPVIELEPGIGLHSREASALAGGPQGDRAVLDGALVLAMTAVQLFTSPDLVHEMKLAFTEGHRS
ncbi:amidohydrolase [Paenarthrobacter nicotinovorans]|uniref:Peptidase M20 domain-containing protein 2 n=1 Tax=Paenarthrobacter nicotinovorans TaxID=29320 RepID=A0ABT9TQ16_PAENI|nr:amidohydrolase [Paenarthrobacter nicotinovorans]MDQ0103166.1 amidohydrolase [Paenarthrobacter nicotinovorans]GAT88493.1 peptidase M20 domain-containing protein 2 [Paenarthrobacter nicotinovorans]